MADVLIKGMKKPDNCYDNCPFCNNWVCTRLHRPLETPVTKQKPFEDCPIESLPENYVICIMHNGHMITKEFYDSLN